MCLENRWWQYLQQFLNNKTLHNVWLLLHVGSQVVQITPFTKEKRNLGNQMLSTFNWEKKVLEMIYNFSKKTFIVPLVLLLFVSGNRMKMILFSPLLPSCACDKTCVAEVQLLHIKRTRSTCTHNQPLRTVTGVWYERTLLCTPLRHWEDAIQLTGRHMHTFICTQTHPSNHQPIT